MTHRDVAVEVTIAAPIEVVWRALREAGEIRRWHGWEFDGLDEEIDTIYRSAVEEVADGPERRLRTAATVIEVGERGSSTVVTFVLAAPPEDESWQGWYEDVRSGWLTFAQQLRFALERHPGEDRRTVFVAGTPAADGPGPIELLGLAGVGGPGSPYAASLPTGDEITGEVWFRTAGQVGVTVAGWGDGLLVVADRYPTGAVLSMYGTDPGELAQRWETWWGEHFPAA